MDAVKLRKILRYILNMIKQPTPGHEKNTQIKLNIWQFSSGVQTNKVHKLTTFNILDFILLMP